MKRSLMVLVCAGIVSMAYTGQAQNLLVNGDLESSPSFTYFDGFDPTVSDDVPGWNIFLGAADGSYVQISLDGGAGTIDLDTGSGPAGGGIETAAGSRPAVTPGSSYKASMTFDNYFGGTSAAYFIDWFDGVGALISSDGGVQPDANGPLTFLPYTQLASVTGIAPATAASAGVRFTSGNGNYNGLTADNFSLTAVPEPATMSLLAIAGFGLLGRRGSRR